MNLSLGKKIILTLCLFSFVTISSLYARVSVIPEPKSITVGDGEFVLTKATKITAGNKQAQRSAELFNAFLSSNYGVTLQNGSGGNAVKLVPDSRMGREAYTLTVDRNGVTIRGGDAGIFYGLQTLQQIIAEKDDRLTVPFVAVDDEPRFGYRGMMLDVGRYFYPVDYIKEFIDLMSFYKLNTFHWHLTEDCGWRIEIKRYPELTNRGAWRRSTQYTHNAADQDGIPHGGFYTQEQVKDILAYAADRNVNIIPEIDMPGHTMTMLLAYPEISCTGGPFPYPMEQWGIREDVLCIGNEKTFEIVEGILEELIELFPSPYINIGGDEAPRTRWDNCPKCQARIKAEGLNNSHELQNYFVNRIERFVADKGRRIVGWDEIIEGDLAKDAIVMSWRGTKYGTEAVSRGYNVIMAPTTYMYFDYYQSKDRSTEPYNIGGYIAFADLYNYEPATGMTPQQEDLIIGVQGNIWCEFIHHPRKVEYMGYPRALALAEIGWSPASKKDYAKFLERLPWQLNYLDRRGVAFRIPEPLGLNEARIKGDKAVVTLKPLVEGAEIYYTTDGSDPVMKGKRYTAPVEVPLSFDGINMKCILRLPSGRTSATYRVTAVD